MLHCVDIKYSAQQQCFCFLDTDFSLALKKYAIDMPMLERHMHSTVLHHYE